MLKHFLVFSLEIPLYGYGQSYADSPFSRQHRPFPRQHMFMGASRQTASSLRIPNQGLGRLPILTKYGAGPLDRA